MKTLRDYRAKLLKSDPEFARLSAIGESCMEITEAICEIMESRNISKKDLARMSGRSESTVSRFLNSPDETRFRTFIDILNALGLKAQVKESNGRKV